VDFVSQQQVPNDSHIEPAWRAPELPSFAPVKRPTVKRATLAPEIETFLRLLKRRSRYGHQFGRAVQNKPKFPNADTIFRGQSMMPVYITISLRILLDVSQWVDLSLPYQATLPRARESGEISQLKMTKLILDWVARAKARGQALLSNVIWRELEAKVNLPNSPSGRPDEKHSIQITPLSRGNLTTIAVLHICRTRPMTTNQIQRTSVELQHALPRAKRARVKFTAEE